MGRSVAETDGVRVTVHSRYVPERSRPREDYYFFAYKVRIENDGPETAQLISRHWVIANGDGHVEEVRGPGVVGETPRLEPGESFEYQSFCPLSTMQGTMRGTYEMRRPDGRSFDAEIAPFALELPVSLN